jgi:hypothetical protein
LIEQPIVTSLQLLLLRLRIAVSARLHRVCLAFS